MPTLTPQDLFKPERCVALAPDIFALMFERLKPEARFVDPNLNVEHVLLLDGNSRRVCFYVGA